MWGRVVEIMMATWLAISPFVFRAQADSVVYWTDQAFALVITLAAGLSYWRPTRHAHLLIIPVSLALSLWGRFYESPPTPVHQNHILVGLFLLMIALVPNQASLPPRSWREAACD